MNSVTIFAEARSQLGTMEVVETMKPLMLADEEICWRATNVVYRVLMAKPDIVKDPLRDQLYKRHSTQKSMIPYH